MLADWERTMGEQMGALPGQHIICEDMMTGDLRVVAIDFITDNDGWCPPEFVLDAETHDHVLPGDLYAVVLPGADPEAALAQATVTFNSIGA